jgi:hypothetical protein
MTSERLEWLEAQRDGGEVPDYSGVLEWLTECLAALRAEHGAFRALCKLLDASPEEVRQSLDLRDAPVWMPHAIEGRRDMAKRLGGRDGEASS